MRTLWLVALATLVVALLLVGGCGGHGGQVSGPPAPGASTFVGRAVCAVCHSAISKSYGTYNGPVKYANFVGSAHGQDMHSKGPNNLDVLDNFGGACLPCHTVGYGAPGGFTSLKATPQLAGIGCEDCHGPGSTHAGSPSSTDINKLPDASTTCWNCHSPSYKLLAQGTPATVTDATLAGKAPNKVGLDSSQAAFLEGYLGFNRPQLVAAHGLIDNTCVTCHLNPDTTDHHSTTALQPDYNACAPCHGNAQTTFANFDAQTNATLIVIGGASPSDPTEPDTNAGGGLLAAYAAAHNIDVTTNNNSSDPAVRAYKAARYDYSYLLNGVPVHNPKLTSELLADAQSYLQ